MLYIAAVTGLATGLFGFACQSLYLHRGITHRAVEYPKGVAVFFRTTIWLTSGSKPWEWVAVHRYHHKSPDNILDPHSPWNFKSWGRLRIVLGSAFYYRKGVKRIAIFLYAGDVKRDKLDKLFQYGGLGPTLFILAFVPLFGTATIAGVVTHTLVVMGIYGYLNAFGHGAKEAKPYVGHSMNRRLFSLISFGEGLHGNHHANPLSPKFSHDGQHEFDPGWQIVRLLCFLRLARLTNVGTKEWWAEMTGSAAGV